jgi:glutathione synthase
MTARRILVVMDRQFDAAHDTSVAIIEEALGRGLRVDVCDTDDLHYSPAGAAGEARRVRAAGRAGMALDECCCTPLARYAAILYRKDPPFTIDTLYATLLLEHSREHSLLINDPRGLREANEKLFALRFPALTPPTAVLREPRAIRAFCHAHDGACVLKPLDSCGGRGIFVLRAGDPNAGAIIEAATHDGSRLAIAQALLPVEHHGDKRIFILDGEPIGALLRVPHSGEARANLHQGGTPHATTLTTRERQIAHTVGAACRKLGLHLVGIDVIAGHLTEVNVTSPTGFREIERLTGARLQQHFLDWLTTRLPLPSRRALASAA